MQPLCMKGSPSGSKEGERIALAPQIRSKEWTRRGAEGDSFRISVPCSGNTAHQQCLLQTKAWRLILQSKVTVLHIRCCDVCH